MFCKECGQENRNDRKFCSNCGTELRDYTKPRENLVMAEEVMKEQALSDKIKKVTDIFSVIMAVVYFAGIIFLIPTFFFTNDIQLVFIVICFTCMIAYLFLCLIKRIIIKKLKKAQQ